MIFFLLKQMKNGCARHSSQCTTGILFYQRTTTDKKFNRAGLSLHHYRHSCMDQITSYLVHGTQTPEGTPEPIFLNVYRAQESIPGMNSATLCSLAGRHDNPIPTRFVSP
jgi:hypothetical protein